MGLFNWGGSPKDRFARQVLRVVKATGRVTSAEYDESDFSISYQLAGAGTGRIYLENTYRETEGAEPREQALRIERLVTAVVSSDLTNDTWELARPKLRPVLRGVGFGAETLGNTHELVARPALPFLMEAVVVDEPTSMAYLTRKRLHEWRVSEDEVFANARANLAAGAGSIDGPPSDGPAMLRFVDSGDAYFTSMLLVKGFLAGLAPRVGGRPIAFIPDRDTLIVTADQPESLASLYELVEEQYTNATRSISPVGYTVDDHGAVVPYPAPPGTPLAETVHRAESLLAGVEYRGQKQALDAAHERDGIDIFVASLMVLQRQGSAVYTLAVWSQDVDTLLPRADVVDFQPAQPPLVVPFDIVAREAGLVPEPGYALPRYRVTAWPDEAVMARLRAHAVTR